LNGRGYIYSVVAAALVVVLLFSWSAGGQAQVFDVAARAAILIDAETGQVLFEKNADQPYEPASLVKIMTLLVAMDAVKAGRVSLADPVRTSRRAAAVGGSQVYLAWAKRIPLEKMLKAVAIASGNDASMAVAEFIAGTEDAFVQLMNERARQIGMTQSRFTNADGLPPEPGEEPSLASARDIAFGLADVDPRASQSARVDLHRDGDLPRKSALYPVQHQRIGG